MPATTTKKRSEFRVPSSEGPTRNPKAETKDAEPELPAPRDVARLVSEGTVLADVVELGRKAEQRLDVIKTQLRSLVPAGEEAQFHGLAGEVATVKPVADGLRRSVPEEMVVKVKELCGRRLSWLFNLAPVTKFELAAFKILPSKKEAEELVALMRVPSSARVAFVAAPAAAE